MIQQLLDGVKSILENEMDQHTAEYRAIKLLYQVVEHLGEMEMLRMELAQEQAQKYLKRNVS